MKLFDKLKKIPDNFNVKVIKMQNEAKEKLSFIDVFGQIVAIGKNPKLSREEKFQKLREELDRLSGDEFATNIDNILKIIQNKKENCEQFKSTQEQVNSIMEIVPRLKPYEQTVIEIIKERRKGFDLLYE